MTPLEGSLAFALRLLDRPHALVGGLAVGARTEPRFTRDVDLAVSVPDDSGAEEVVRRFLDHGCELFGMLQHDQTGRLVTARLVAPHRERTVVDLLFASCGIEPEVAQAAQLVVPVATTGHLLAMKLLSRQEDRPQDAIDLVALRRLSGPADLEEARRACELIVKRGYHRGRPLPELLEQIKKAER